MTDSLAISLARDALVTALLVAAPVLGLGLVTGVVVSLFQATTQINEQTLAFIPKIIAIFAAILVFGPWMFQTVIDYTHRVFTSIPSMVG